MIDVWESIARTIVALAVVLALMGLATWAARRVLGQRSGIAGAAPIVHVLATGYLAPRKSIAVVSVAGEYFVVGMTADNLIPLGRLDNREQIGSLLADTTTSQTTDGSMANPLQTDWFQHLLRSFRSVKKDGPHA
ncbi:MAG: flagellar biosynthetic protein FliO [Nitrospira sp.]